jgi:hypothetical protein
VLKRDTLPRTDADVQAWTNAELDKADHAFHRDLAKAANDWLRSLPPRSKTESRKRWLTIGKRAAAKHHELLEQRAIAESDIETLRRLHPKHAGYLNPPKSNKRGRRKKIGHDPESRQSRLANALIELRRIRTLWKKSGLGKRTRGAITAEQIAAERWGLTEDDVRKRRV